MDNQSCMTSVLGYGNKGYTIELKQHVCSYALSQGLKEALRWSQSKKNSLDFTQLSVASESRSVLEPDNNLYSSTKCVLWFFTSSCGHSSADPEFLDCCPGENSVVYSWEVFADLVYWRNVWEGWAFIQWWSAYMYLCSRGCWSSRCKELQHFCCIWLSGWNSLRVLVDKNFREFQIFFIDVRIC